jgi:hypothetical protein
MREYRYGDLRDETYLLRTEELHVEARAFPARQALPHDTRPARDRARVWLGSILLAAGHRLLRAAPEPAAPA